MNSSHHNTTTSGLYTLSVLILSIFFSVQSVFAQENSSLFVVADFMKVKSRNHNSYLEVEQKIWKPMHQERINQGIIVGWYLYAVEFSGSIDEYNYVVITLYDNAISLENPWKPEIPEKVHPNMRLEEILNKTNNTRDIVKSELYYNVANAPQTPMKVPANYLQVNYMHVAAEKRAEYEALEKEIWLPIHNESIKSGHTSGWGLWSTLFPRGAGRPYQYITLNAFSEFSYLFEVDFALPFANIHPEKDFTEIQQETRQLRSMVRVELWDLIDYAVK